MWLSRLTFLPTCFFLSLLSYVSSQNVTISGPEDLKVPLASVIKGSLIISAQFNGSIKLDGVQRVNGDIECIEGALDGLTSSSLTSIGGSLRLHGLSKLTSVTFSNLQSLEILDLDDVPILSQLDLHDGFNNISEIYITNSGLKTFTAHPPRPGSVIEMFNNSALINITFPFAQEEVGRPWVRIVSPATNAIINLGDVIHARFLVLKGFLSSIRGLENLQIVDRDLLIENKLDFDCSQFSELRYGTFTCSGKNSTAVSSLSAVGLATVRVKPTGSSNLAGPANPTDTNKTASDSPASPNTGLSTGAKAAIGILAAALVAALALLAFFLLRYRKAVATNGKHEDPAAPQELPTGGHHEKTELPNDESLDNFYGTSPVSPIDNRNELPSPISSTGNAHELPTSASARQFSEVDSSPISRKEVLSPGVGITASNVEEGSTSDADKKLDVLKSRLEMVRSDKERLSKLRDLDELERELKEEIMAEQRKVY